jgi:hypothetical protein
MVPNVQSFHGHSYIAPSHVRQYPKGNAMPTIAPQSL